MTINEKVIEIASKNRFNGVILICKDQRKVVEECIGFADMEKRIGLNPHTKMRIASISKQMTAVGILKLLYDGKLSLDDTLDLYFKDYKNGAVITIHHLLSNTSGIPNFELFNDYGDLYNNVDFYDSFIKEVIYPLDLHFNPGKQFEYSGSGYLFLTSIIEKVSGLPYDVFMKSNIFEPLKMNDSGFDFLDLVLDNRAIPYDYIHDEYVKAAIIDLRLGGGGGGLYSSMNDMYLWNLSLLQNILLPSEYINKIFTSYIDIIETTGYGYGMFLEVSEASGKVIARYYHTGGGPGVQAVNVFFASDNITLTMISNVNDKHQFHNTRNELYELLLESDIL